MGDTGDSVSTSSDTLGPPRDDSSLSTKDVELASPVSEDEGKKNLLLVPVGWMGLWFYFKLSSFWFAFSVMNAALPTVVWPAQIEIMVGQAQKDSYNGYVPAIGAFVSLVVTPIAGYLSDKSRSRFGKRRIFLIIGTIIAFVFLILLGFVGKAGGNIWVFTVLTCGQQFGASFAAGPYAGLIPDLVHPVQRGTASGYNGLAQTTGYLVSLVVAGELTSVTAFWRVYVFLAIFFALFSLPTIIGLPEPPRDEDETYEPASFRGFWKSLYLDPKLYKSFYWVIATRGMEQMGYYTITPYLQYFIEDVVKIANPTKYASLLFIIILVISVPFALGIGRLSDKIGRKICVYISTGIMTAMMFLGIFISIYVPTISALFVAGAIFGVGYGSFLGVDWALALDTLPPDADTAKDMGLWHISFVLPQAIAPVIAGSIITKVKQTSSGDAYGAIFGIASAWFLLSGVFVTMVILRKQQIQKK